MARPVTTLCIDCKPSRKSSKVEGRVTGSRFFSIRGRVRCPAQVCSADGASISFRRWIRRNGQDVRKNRVTSRQTDLLYAVLHLWNPAWNRQKGPCPFGRKPCRLHLEFGGIGSPEPETSSVFLTRTPFRPKICSSTAGCPVTTCSPSWILAEALPRITPKIERLIYRAPV